MLFLLFALAFGMASVFFSPDEWKEIHENDPLITANEHVYGYVSRLQNVIQDDRVQINTTIQSQTDHNAENMEEFLQNLINVYQVTIDLNNDNNWKTLWHNIMHDLKILWNIKINTQENKMNIISTDQQETYLLLQYLKAKKIKYTFKKIH